MSETYFKSFPKWGTTDSTDLLTHVFPVPKSLIRSNNIEPITLKDTDFVERVAHIFYNDPNLFYILFLVNRVVHPYEDWVINQSELTRAVFDKYHEAYLEKHKARVIEQLESFMYYSHKMVIQKILPTGRYILKVAFTDRKGDGEVQINLKYFEKYQEANLVPSTVVFQHITSPGVYKNELFFDDELEKNTRLTIKKDSHVKFKLNPINFQTISFNEMFSSKKLLVSIPTEITVPIGFNETVYIEIQHNVANRYFYIQGLGKNITMELYNASSKLLVKTFSNTVSFKDFLSLLVNFNAEKVESFESSELYLYSTQLIKKLAIEINQSFSDSQQIEGSIHELINRLVNEYNKNFNPTIFSIDDFVDLNFSGTTVVKVKAAILSSEVIGTQIKTIDNYTVNPGDKILVNGQNKKSNFVYVVQDDYSLTKSSNDLNGAIIIVEYGTIFRNTRWFYDKSQNEFLAYNDIPFSYIYNSDLMIKFNSSKIYHYYMNDVLNDTHHYETDSTSEYGPGMIVDELSVINESMGNLVRVSNMDYESKKNDKNRFKFGLAMTMVNDFQKQYRDYLIGIVQEDLV
jgi:hypothetical protein